MSGSFLSPREQEGLITPTHDRVAASAQPRLRFSEYSFQLELAQMLRCICAGSVFCAIELDDIRSGILPEEDRNIRSGRIRPYANRPQRTGRSQPKSSQKAQFSVRPWKTGGNNHVREYIHTG
jgi:hypothetical protein